MKIKINRPWWKKAAVEHSLQHDDTLAQEFEEILELDSLMGDLISGDAGFIACGVEDGVWKALVTAADGTITYSDRDTVGTIINSDGNVQELPAYCVRSKNARVVYNEVEEANWPPPNSSSDLTTITKGSNVTLTYLSADEGTKFELPDLPSVYAQIDYTKGPVYSVTFAVKKGGTSVDPVRLSIRDASITKVLRTITPTDSWQYISLINDSSSYTNDMRLLIDRNAGDDVDVQLKLMVENISSKFVQNAPSEFISSGILADDGLFHGCGLDGVKAFATSAHNNSVDANGIITFGTASGDISDNIYYLAEPAATNYADGDDDLSGGAETIDLTAAGTGDYTLSLMGTAAVTVAAGTATGTGFGQATEGNPVTFNLTVAGTITLTLDSGTLDKSGGLAIKQVEKASVASSWIPTSGGSGSRTADMVSYDSDSNYAAAEGTLIMRVKSRVAFSDINYTGQFFGLRTGLLTLLYHNSIQGLRSYDGVNSVSLLSQSWGALDELYFAVRWNADTGKAQIGLRNITDSGIWVKSNEDTYDGAHVDDGIMYLVQSTEIPWEIKSVELFQIDKGFDWIEANY